MKDTIEVGSVYKNIDLLKFLKLDIFLKKRKQSSYVLLRWNKRQNRVRTFNCKVCGHGKKIYSLNNPALVAPMSFIKHVLQYQASQSRVCIDMNGLVGPSASYPTVSNCLASQSTQPIPFPLSDCQLAINNDQVVGKSWQITSTHLACFVAKKEKKNRYTPVNPSFTI